MTDEQTPEDIPDAAANNGGAGTDGAPAVAVASSSTGDKIVAWLGEENAERPKPTLVATFAGIGGLLAAYGLMVAVAGDSPNPRGKIVTISIVLLALALAVRQFVKIAPLQAAAVGIAVAAIPAFAIAATVGDGDNAGFLTGAVLAVVALAAWALPGLKHRHILLAIGALALVSAFGSLSGPDTSDADRCMAYLDAGDYETYDAECYDVYYDESSSLLPTGITDNFGDQGAIYLAGAVVRFGLTWWLDRRGRKGPGAALAVAGLLSAISGTALFAADLSGKSAALFVLLVGLVVCAVGTHGARRATTWWGAAMAAIGLVWFVALEWQPESSASMGGMMIVSGLILLAVGTAAAAVQQAIEGEATTQPAGVRSVDQ